ncbi:MAG TPA: sensor histidine kinase [Bacteroidales bacterium]|nr:MAG: histidine kinase [Bacteroidetes bacterium GWF2_33_38]HBF87885.1 sensor histidine kinase [Bacteroidales bacterium]
MRTKYFKQNNLKQYIISILVTVSISAICFSISDIIGYRTVALLLLASVSLLAFFFSVYPILVSATLSALIWDFFFIPPHFTLHVDKTEDVLMLSMYFLVALLNGVLTSKIRQYEKEEYQKEERQNTIKLYKTLFDSISHELRTPIATIVGASDNILSQTSPQLTEKNKENLVNEISIAAFRLNRLIDNLLNMQRLESGFLKPKLDWCDINEVIENVQNRLENELKSHSVKIEIENDLPLMKLDAGLIEQAIHNIVYNATVYTPQNSEINIKIHLENNNLLITISDNGQGFASEEIMNVFTKYFYSKKAKSGGIGLGLSISKGFIEAHKGKISVENQANSGAKFTINIPIEFFVINDNFDFSDFTKKEKNEQ